MANEILIKVRVDDGVDPGLASIMAKIKEWSDGLTTEMGGDGRKAGDKAGNEIAGALNRQLRELHLPEIDIKANARDAEAMLEELRIQVHRLASDDVTIEVKAKTERALAQIEAFKKSLATTGDEVSQGFVKTLVSDLTQSGPVIQGVLGIIAVAAAPTIAATIGGAIAAGIGLAGIGGAIAAVAKEPEVTRALDSIKSELGDRLRGAAVGFVDTAVKGIHEIGGEVAKIDFAGIFADSAKNAQPIIDGIASAVHALGGAIADIVHNDGPVLKEIGDEFAALGNIIADGLEGISAHSTESAHALSDLFYVVNLALEATFGLINGLTTVYGWLDKITAGGPVELFKHWGDATSDTHFKTVQLGSALNDSADAVERAAGKQQDWKKDLDTTTAALRAQDDEIHAVADSLKASTDPLFAFMNAQDGLTEKENAMNRAIRANGANSKEARAATREYQKALIDYISAAAGATNGTGHLTAQQKQLLASAGTSKKRINELDAALYAAWKQANRLDNFNVDIDVNTHFKQFGKPYSQMDPYQFHGLAHGGVKGAASGVTSSGLTWTGERGPELLDLPPGTMVRTAGDSARTAQAAGGGTATVMVSFDKSGLSGLAATLVETLRAEIRYGGGNVQQYLGVAGK